MDQLVLVIVIAAIGLIKWLMEKSAEQRAKREMGERIDREVPAPPERAPRPTAYPVTEFDLDKAARRLREALGLPEEARLPPLVPKGTVVAPHPMVRSERAKPVPAVDLEQRVVVAAVPPPPVPKREPKGESVPATRSSLDDLLRSRDGLRKAILVQEILGTPKGLVF